MSWHFLSWVGIALLGLGTFLALREHSWLRSAQVAPATVVALLEERGSKGKTIYTPRVRYLTPDGTPHTFDRGYASRPPEFTVGQEIHVAYDPATSRACILTFGHRYGLSVFLLAIGACLLALSTAFALGPAFISALYLK